MTPITSSAWILCIFSLASAAAPMKGVNLGGWMVLESWIYPNWWQAVTGGHVPAGVGEYQFCGMLGQTACKAILQQHWDTWYNQSDVKALADGGVTHVRIPIGYWIAGPEFLLPGDKYITGGWPYLQRMLGWLKAAGIKAVIDLHGAPGSQNGHDNSGNSAGIGWNTPDNINRTIAVLQYLAANLTILNRTTDYEGVVAGIEVLNEPWTTVVGGPITLDTLKSFVQAATTAILSTGFEGMIWFPDGWNLAWSGWDDFLPPPQYQNILIDTHLYHCFGGFDQLTNWGQVNYTCAVDLPRLRDQVRTDWVVVGEYSLCVPNNAPQFPYGWDDQMFLRAYAESQMQAYGVFGGSASQGAFFWNAKTESAWEWNYLAGLQYGYVPNLSHPLTQSAFDCTSI